MNTYANSTQKNKSQSIATAVSQKKSKSQSTFQFVDNRPEAIEQRKLQDMANNSPQAKQAAQLQSLSQQNSLQEQPIQKKANDTGLPDNLKSGIENLSGYSMDDVRVHYNSDNPAQLQAHAYAQGTDIHIASGQEKHLPHEAWHVVQQKQGRVRPTLQMKGKVNVNDDAGLEKEADVMGEKSVQMTGTLSDTNSQNKSNVKPDFRLVDNRSENIAQLQENIENSPRELAQQQQTTRLFIQAQYQKKEESKSQPPNSAPSTLHQIRSHDGIVQGAFWDIESAQFPEFVDEQKKKQEEWKEHTDTGFTTVGFEHEFTQTDGDSNELAGISHLELAKGSPLAYTGLSFILETDAANALELVSPPYLIKTLWDSAVPDPADVEKVDAMTRESLENLADRDTIGDLVSGFAALGIHLSSVPDLKVERKNVSFKSEVRDYSASPEVDFENLKNIKIKPSEKNGGITSQVNFATDAHTFDKFQKINQERLLDTSKDGQGFDPKAIIATLEHHLKTTMSTTSLFNTENLKVFANQMARTLAGQFAVPAIHAVKKMQAEVFEGKDMEAEKKVPYFRLSAYLSSAVKDVHGTWLKDSLMNVGLGLLSPDEWNQVKESLATVREGIQELILPSFKNINGYENNLEKGNELIQSTLEEAKTTMVQALELISSQIDWVSLDGRPTATLGIVPTKEVGFMEHNEGMIGPRQDTYIDPRKAQVRGAKARYHVVETRKDSLESLYKLGLQTGHLGKESLEKIKKGLVLKLRSISEQNEEILLKIEEVRQGDNELKLERHEVSEELEQLTQNYDTTLEKACADYKKEKKTEDVPKKQLKKIIGKLDQRIANRKKRMVTIKELLTKSEEETPKRIHNLLEKHASNIKEMGSLELELEQVLKQL